MKSNLFIPRRIKVGFQERSDTYTGKLAYVIYYDEKGKLRKEASWESWRKKEIDPQEYDNEPMDGFVLNKKVGGYAGDWGNFRQAYVRVYDPRGFEFEITVPNLLYILENTSSIKGKGLEGSFVYGWDGTDLVLVPTCSPDYGSLSKLNEKRFDHEAIKAKDLKIGAIYLTKQNTRLIYMGRFDHYEQYGYWFDGKFFSTYARMDKYAKKNNLEVKTRSQFYSRYGGVSYDNHYTNGVGTDEQHFFFYYPDRKGWNDRPNPGFVTYKSVSGLLIDTISDQPVENYAELFELLEHDTQYSPHDTSRDEKRFYTADDLADELKGGNGKSIETDIGNVSITPFGDKCVLSTYDSDVAARLENHFALEEGSKPSYRTRTLPVTSDEIIQKLHPYYIAQYLKNGKFYRRY